MAQQIAEYGVVYTPASIGPAVGQQKSSISDAMLDHLGVRYIRMMWNDWTNTTRYHVLTRPYFRKLLRSSRPGITVTAAAFGIVFLHIVEGFSVTGEYLIALDESSFRLSPYEPGHATIFCFFQHLTPRPEYGLELLECPRTQLRRMERLAEEKAGVSYLVGVESEFTLLKETSPPVAVNNYDYGVSMKLGAGNIETKCVLEIVEKLEEAGIELQKYHSEAAPGQYEIIPGPLPPMQAADALLSTRETIYQVANKYGLRATFAPRLHVYSAGNAAHTHISVHELRPRKHSPREDDARAPTMTPTERSFLQGILSHIPALCALTLPTTFSYGRVMDGIWSGGTYAAWGTENREASVRVCGPAGNHHFEARFVDGTSCPYLVLAGLLGAGTQGIIEGAILQSGDCLKSVATMSEDEKREAGVLNAGRLGPTLKDARKHLENDKGLRQLLSDDFVDKYCRVNASLEELFVADTEAELTTKLVNYW